MQERKTADFKRGIKALATQQGWFVEIGEAKGPTERLVIFQREDGEVRRIATLLLREDQKVIGPGWARLVIRKLQSRTSTELTAADQESLRRAVLALINWIQSWF